MVGVVEGSAAFYWLISTHELERPSDWLISSCGTRVGLWQQGGGRLLKFLGEADESTEINPHFVDRPEILAWIRDKCAGLGARAALAGLGGIGWVNIRFSRRNANS